MRFRLDQSFIQKSGLLIKSWLKSPKVRLIIFITALLFTFVIRTHNYDKVPGIGHLEEMMYGWSGMYLIETGVPVAWSTLDYPKEAKIYSGPIDYQGSNPTVYVDLYKPWLDEPPLFSLLVGEVSHLYHADRNSIIAPAFLRLPSIIIAFIISIFVFLIARMVSGYWTGILAMLLYGTIPTIVLGSRMAVAENFIALAYVLVVYLILKFELKQKLRYLLFIPLLVGLAGLSKPTGYFILPFALFFVFSKKYFKSFVYLILATLPFVGLFFLYGLHFSPEIFWRINSIQAARPVGFASLAWFFVSPAYDITPIIDGWYIFCVLSAFYFLLSPLSNSKEAIMSKKKGAVLLQFSNSFSSPAGLRRIISWAFIYWIIVVMISGGQTDLLPWYRFPAFPFLAILGAWGIEILVEHANFFMTIIASGTLLTGRHLLTNAFRPDISPLSFRLFLAGVSLPSLAQEIINWAFLKKISQLIIIIIIVAGIYFNSVYIYNVFEINCENQSCPFGASTFLSSIHFPIIWRLFVLGPSVYK